MGPASLQDKFFIGEVSDGIESILSKCKGDAKLRGTESTLENRTGVQNDFNRRGKLSQKNRLQCNKAVGKSLHVSKKNTNRTKANESAKLYHWKGRKYSFITRYMMPSIPSTQHCKHQ